MLALVVLGVAALVLSLRPDAPPVVPGPSPTLTGPTTTGPTRPSDLPTGATWLGTVDLTSSDILTEGGDFLDVTAQGHGVMVSDTGIRVDRLDLEATMPWAAAARQIGPDVEVYAAGPGRAGLARTVTLLGQQVPIRASGTVRAQDGLLVIEPTEIDLEGPDWLDSLASSLARSLVTVRQPVQGLPEGLRLVEVRVIETGLRATLSGSQVTITSNRPR